MTYPEPETIDSYELALQILSDHGERISSAECADVAHWGLTGQLSRLLAWEAPE